MSSETIPATAAQIDARMLVKHMRQAPDDWAGHEALAEGALLAAEQRGQEKAAEAKRHLEAAMLSADPYQHIRAAIRSLGEKT